MKTKQGGIMSKEIILQGIKVLFTLLITCVAFYTLVINTNQVHNPWLVIMYSIAICLFPALGASFLLSKMKLFGEKNNDENPCTKTLRRIFL